MLEKEFQYYLDNQADLVKKYEGKYLVIMGEEVVETFSSDEEAYFDSESKHELGTFLIQYCEEGERAYTQSIHSQVSF